MSNESTQMVNEIRGVLIPLQNSQLLLPNAAVAEVVDYHQPDSLSEGPDWLLGTTSWRQRNLMLVRLESLFGETVKDTSARQRIIVCHALSVDAKRPFIGIVASSIPRLVRVREAMLESQEMTLSPDMPIHAQVLIDGQPAIIPDISALEKMLADVA